MKVIKRLEMTVNGSDGLAWQLHFGYDHSISDQRFGADTASASGTRIGLSSGQLGSPAVWKETLREILSEI